MFTCLNVSNMQYATTQEECGVARDLVHQHGQTDISMPRCLVRAITKGYGQGATTHLEAGIAVDCSRSRYPLWMVCKYSLGLQVLGATAYHDMDGSWDPEKQETHSSFQGTCRQK